MVASRYPGTRGMVLAAGSGVVVTEDGPIDSLFRLDGRVSRSQLSPIGSRNRLRG